MKINKLMGIVFGNTNDELLGEMTERRAISSIPFGGRYRLIDFTLSNLVQADVSRVAVVTRSNYKSLMDHIESGKSWDLARKNGGLYVIPPNSYADSGLNESKIRSVAAILDFIDHAAEEYVALCDGDTVSNFDLKDMFRQHLDSGADITIAYKHGIAPTGHRDVMAFDIADSGRIKDITLTPAGIECDFSLDVIVLSKSLLRTLIENAVSRNYTSLSADVFQREVANYVICGYNVTGYAEIIDSLQTYISANMKLLDSNVRHDLFRGKHQVYTKVRNEMPAKYGLDSSVSNSLISDGCIIEGTVINSVLFRGVKVGKGSVVRNCVLMQSTDVGDSVTLDYVCTDKNVKITPGRTLSGSEMYTVYIRKGSVV